MVTKQPAAKAKTAKAAPAVASAVDAHDAKNALQKRRTAIGIVKSNKMQKTIVVEVERQVRHGLYMKYISKTRRFKAHDEKNEAKIGDKVSLVESRPMSREKRWVLQSILRKAGQVVDVDV